MVSNKYMEQIILEELDTFKKKRAIATAAVNEYSDSIEEKVRQLLAHDVQGNFKELQKLLQESSQTFDRVTIGLANLVPSTNGTLSRPIEDVTRPMITSNTLRQGPSAQWSSSDCSVKNDNEQRMMSSPSPDIVESTGDPLVEPSSSSASSNTSTSRPPFKARMLNILKQQPQRSSLDDEFAMEIPEPSTTLNVDAPEFTPCDPLSLLGRKSSFSQTSTDTIAANTERTRSEPQTQPQDQTDALEDQGPDAQQQTPGACSSRMETDSNVPKVITSSSSMESFLTASATDSEQYKDEEQNARTVVNTVTGFEALAQPSSGVDARDSTSRLAPNCYPNGAESRPSSLCTKNVIYDTAQVLRDAAQQLTLTRDQPRDVPSEEAEPHPPNGYTQIEAPKASRLLAAAGEENLTESGDSFQDAQSGDSPSKWSSRQTAGEIPKDVRKTRIPPLWTYVLVTFSDVDVDSGKVYVQMLSDELYVDQLSEEMNGPQMVAKPLRMLDITADLIVIAPFQGQLFRAKVISKRSENDIEVLFIDYGNKATVRLEDLAMAHKKLTKTCKIAIPCILGDTLRDPKLLEDLPESAYVCLAEPKDFCRETVYRIVDIMPHAKENLRELPESVPFNALEDPSVFPYSVVVTHATSPSSLWLVEAKDMNISKQIEQILEDLPVEPCIEKLATKSNYIAYAGKRAMVLNCLENRVDLLLLDDGRLAKNVPLSKCRRLPHMAHMYPRAAKPGRLANCHVKEDAPGLEELMKTLVIGKTFDMKVKNDDSDEVILVDPKTRKYVAKEITAKYGH